MGGIPSVSGSSSSSADSQSHQSIGPTTFGSVNIASGNGSSTGALGGSSGWILAGLAVAAVVYFTSKN
jgi:hypothetical protein